MAIEDMLAALRSATLFQLPLPGPSWGGNSYTTSQRHQKPEQYQI
jgi:hypothetical protein